MFLMDNKKSITIKKPFNCRILSVSFAFLQISKWKYFKKALLEGLVNVVVPHASVRETLTFYGAAGLLVSC